MSRAESLGCPCLRFLRLDFTVARGAIRDESIEQAASRLGDLVHRAIEGDLVEA